MPPQIVSHNFSPPSDPPFFPKDLHITLFKILNNKTFSEYICSVQNITLAFSHPLVQTFSDVILGKNRRNRHIRSRLSTSEFVLAIFFFGRKKEALLKKSSRKIVYIVTEYWKQSFDIIWLHRRHPERSARHYRRPTE